MSHLKWCAHDGCLGQRRPSRCSYWRPYPPGVGRFSRTGIHFISGASERVFPRREVFALLPRSGLHGQQGPGVWLPCSQGCAQPRPRNGSAEPAGASRRTRRRRAQIPVALPQGVPGEPGDHFQPANLVSAQRVPRGGPPLISQPVRKRSLILLFAASLRSLAGCATFVQHKPLYLVYAFDPPAHTIANVDDYTLVIGEFRGRESTTDGVAVAECCSISVWSCVCMCPFRPARTCGQRGYARH